jgi:hypothetical protein
MLQADHRNKKLNGPTSRPSSFYILQHSYGVPAHTSVAVVNIMLFTFLSTSITNVSTQAAELLLLCCCLLFVFYHKGKSLISCCFYGLAHPTPAGKA